MEHVAPSTKYPTALSLTSQTGLPFQLKSPAVFKIGALMRRQKIDDAGP